MLGDISASCSIFNILRNALFGLVLNATLVLESSECSWLREGMAESRRGEKGEDNNIVIIINVCAHRVPIEFSFIYFFIFLDSMV